MKVAIKKNKKNYNIKINEIEFKSVVMFQKELLDCLLEQSDRKYCLSWEDPQDNENQNFVYISGLNEEPSSFYFGKALSNNIIEIKQEIINFLKMGDCWYDSIVEEEIEFDIE